MADALYWIWSAVAGFVNWRLIWNEIPNLLEGAKNTLFITSLAVAIGVVMGLAISIMRLSRRRVFRWPGAVYTEMFRCTPMIVQILLFYYGLFPKLQGFLNTFGIPFLTNLQLHRAPAVYAGVAALGLNSGAYLGEIFRGGILSIDKGQREAALSLGMREYQVMYHVVLPQALTNALPSIGNEFLTMIKDSALVSTIAVSELTYRAMLVAARSYEYFTMYVGIGIMYFIMCFTTSRLLARLEKRMRVGQTAADQIDRTRAMMRPGRSGRGWSFSGLIRKGPKSGRKE